MPYVTVSEYADFITRLSGGGSQLSTADESLMESFLSDAQNWIEERTDRWFEGRAQTRYYDSRCVDWNDGSRLLLDADLLSVTDLLNGNGSPLLSSQYRLYPYNESPKWAIRLSQSGAGASWQFSGEGLIAVTGVWGYTLTPTETVKRMVKRIAYQIQIGRTSGSNMTQLPDGTRLFEAALPPDIYDWMRNNKRLRGSYEST